MREVLGQREVALKRSPLKRKRSVQPDHLRDDEFKAWVTLQRCCAPGASCALRSDPHHRREPGIARKSHDRTCIPLCRIHHGEAHDRVGRFKGWTKDEMRDWHDAQSAALLERYRKQPQPELTAMEVF